VVEPFAELHDRLVRLEVRLPGTYAGDEEPGPVLGLEGRDRISLLPGKTQ
jgi:hypothetical protein